jgi:hypothetical protein
VGELTQETALTLTEVLSDPTKKRAVVNDGVLLIESEVRSKSGISGFALKAGFKTVKKLKPGILNEALGKLLPEFSPAVDPFYIKGADSGDVKGYFVRNSDQIAEAMLQVTDRIAKGAKNRVMIKVYSTLRGQAKGHVRAAMPGLADLIGKHV